PWRSHSGSLALTYAVSPMLTAQISYAGKQSFAVDNNPLCCDFFAPPSAYNGPLLSGGYVFPLSVGFTQVGGASSSSVLEEKITAHIGRGMAKVAALQNHSFGTQLINEAGSSTQQLYGAACLVQPGPQGPCLSG